MERITASPGFPRINKPSANQQGKRLGPKFERLREVIKAFDSGAPISADTDGLSPENAIVFELALQLTDFMRAAERVGLTWLGEDELEIEPDEEFFDPKRPKALLSGRLYLAMPDASSMRQLLSLWDLFSKGEKLPYGYSDWETLFSCLKEIRPWGAKDRLPPETEHYLREALSKEPGNINLEIELFCYASSKKDALARKSIAKNIERCGGTILDASLIADIRYHAILASIPKKEVFKLLERTSLVSKAKDIMFIRPQVMSIGRPPLGDGKDDSKFDYTPPENLAPPVAALFDGIPVQNHNLLKDRILIEDPENLQDTAPTNTRRHGTAMASLIIHGDLAAKEMPIGRTLYIHPLLGGTATDPTETTPKNKLLLDLIYRAVLRMKRGEGDIPATADGVIIINLSMGDANRPFSGQISAWARLIDFLSWEYKVIFIISAGNITQKLPVLDCISYVDLAKLSPAERQERIIQSLQNKMAIRTLYSPAECLNAITVGAAHADGGPGTLNALLVDPFQDRKLPNIISGFGLGHRKVVKPDILHDGGKVLCAYAGSSEGLEIFPANPGKIFGQQVAAPTAINASERTVGTSNAAALVTRAGMKIYDVIEEIRESESGSVITDGHVPTLIKALLIHTARWDSAGVFLEKTLAPRDSRLWQKRRDNITKFLGFGAIDVQRALECTAQRATIIGCGTLLDKKADVFSFPLPQSLSGVTDVRRLTVTVAWLSPIAAGTQGYRRAVLELQPDGSKDYPVGVKRVAKNQPPEDTMRRGTVIHEVFQGSDAVPFSMDGMLRIRVQCKSQGSISLPPIPYSVAVSLEVEETLKTDIYQEILERIRPQAKPRVRI